jgi:hypothetical protein
MGMNEIDHLENVIKTINRVMKHEKEREQQHYTSQLSSDDYISKDYQALEYAATAVRIHIVNLEEDNPYG